MQFPVVNDILRLLVVLSFETAIWFLSTFDNMSVEPLFETVFYFWSAFDISAEPSFETDGCH